MSRKAKAVAELHAELVNAQARAQDHNFLIRMQGRKDVARLEAAIIRAERREQRDGELS